MSGGRGRDRRRGLPHGSSRTVDLNDGRVSPTRQALRHLRRPNTTTWYGDLDPRSWAVLAAVARRQRPPVEAWRTALTVMLRLRRSGRCISSLPRSGMHWTAVMLMSALDLAEGGDGEYELVDDVGLRGEEQWVGHGARYLWPNPPDTLLNACVGVPPDRVPAEIFTANHVPLQHRPFDVTRMRPVLLVRRPGDAMRSHLRKHGLDRMEREPHLRRAVLRRPEMYLAYWAEERARRPEGHPHHPLVVRYEEMRADPVAELGRIVDHWDLPVSDAHLERAVEVSRRDVMVDKAGGRDNERVSVRHDALPADVEADLVAALASPALRSAAAAFGYDTLDRAGSGDPTPDPGGDER